VATLEMSDICCICIVALSRKTEQVP
jgi:hypothetical protein